MSQPTGGAPAKKGLSPLVIVLIVIGGLVVLGTVAVVAVGWFVVSKVQEAGIDPELWEKNPGVAVTKMIAALNPNIEIVKIDEDSQQVTVRDKESGKTVTVDFERLREGNLVFEGEGGEQVQFEAGEGGIKVQTEEGNYQLGGGASAQLPGWLDECPGCELTGVMSNQTAEGSGGMVSFTSPESVESVIDFYDRALKDAGLEVNTVRHSGAAGGGGIINGEDRSSGRKAMIVVAKDNNTTGGSITFSE